MESLLTVLASCLSACSLDRLQSYGKESRCDLEWDCSMNLGSELPSPLGCSQNEQKMVWVYFIPRHLTTEHAFACWLKRFQRQCWLGKHWPLKERGQRRDKGERTPTTQDGITEASSSKFQDFSTQGPEGLRKTIFQWRSALSHTARRFGHQVSVLWNCSEWLWAGRPESPLPGIFLCRHDYEEGSNSGSGSAPTPAHKAMRTKCYKLEVRERRGIFPRGFCWGRGLIYKRPRNPVSRVETDLMRQMMGRRGNTQGWRIEVRNSCPSKRGQEEKGFSFLHQSCSEVAYPFSVSLLNPKGAYPANSGLFSLLPPLSLSPCCSPNRW